jgi:hypothetical protein
MKSRITVVGLVLAACTCVVAVGTTAAAATLWTSNVGSDSGSCGASASPCRSISQAIANASDGDTIWVGPGHYGDVNGDGTFTGPGDEQPIETCINTLHVRTAAQPVARTPESGSGVAAWSAGGCALRSSGHGSPRRSGWRAHGA